MDPGTKRNDLDTEVRRLEESFAADRALARHTNRLMMGITAALSLIIIGFFLVNYLNLSSKWTREKFSRSLEREMAELSPTAVRHLNLLGRDLLPVYAEEGRKQLLAMGPEIARELESQLDQLTEDLLARVHQQMLQTQERVLEQSEEVLLAEFPSLHDAEQREQIERRFRAITEDALAVALSRFEQRFSRDVASTRESLLKLDVSDTEEPTVDLQKKFIHLWLELLDQEIMEL